MDPAIIYHNPRCSKSRATLALLEENQIEHKVIKYLESPPSTEEISKMLKLLDLNVRQILRIREPEYQAAGFADSNLSDEQIIALLTQHPKVMERPIVIYNDQAVIGRPPENLLSILS